MTNEIYYTKSINKVIIKDTLHHTQYTHTIHTIIHTITHTCYILAII